MSAGMGWQHPADCPCEDCTAIAVPDPHRKAPAEDLTPEGIQLVIPGAERVQAPDVKQMELF